MRPRARRDGVEVQHLGAETIVYDLGNHRVHRLNPMAAEVWRRCDGTRTPADLARALPGDLGDAAREQIVALTLERLRRVRLLDPVDGKDWPAGGPSLPSRRQALRQLGLAAALLPVVTSILAPTPAHAASCFPPGTACTVGTECCSFTCGNATPGLCD